MNVYLLRSPELNIGTYENVLHLLQQFHGPIKFINCENENQTSENQYSDEIHTEFKRVKTWEQFFTECDNYRLTKKVSQDDIVILLTDIGNDRNWFGGVSPSMKNYFIQTSNWGSYFGNVDIRFPIAYEVIAWVIRSFMFKDEDTISKGVHETPRGCLMDLCKEKSQIILKMLTADICESCMKTYKEQDVENLKILQFFKALDGIRESLIFRSRTILLKKPSKIEIDLNTEKKSFYLTDLNLILPLNPKEKSLYMLFLKNDKGLKISELKNYEEELKKNYTLFAYNEDLEAQEKSIKLLTNSEKNNNNETISKINRKIKNNVGIELYDFYCIAGERGKAKHIKLNREFINIIEYKQISKR